jgi:hypothetical protein
MIFVLALVIVNETSEIGQFKIISHDYDDGRWRVRFKLVEN